MKFQTAGFAVALAVAMFGSTSFAQNYYSEGRANEKAAAQAYAESHPAPTPPSYNELAAAALKREFGASDVQTAGSGYLGDGIGEGYRYSFNVITPAGQKWGCNLSYSGGWSKPAGLSMVALCLDPSGTQHHNFGTMIIRWKAGKNGDVISSYPIAPSAGNRWSLRLAPGISQIIVV